MYLAAGCRVLMLADENRYAHEGLYIGYSPSFNAHIVYFAKSDTLSTCVVAKAGNRYSTRIAAVRKDAVGHDDSTTAVDIALHRVASSWRNGLVTVGEY